MARNRKRKDWPQRVYVFHAAPVGVVPEGVFEVARAQQALWNRLAILRRLAGQDVTMAPDRERKAIWAEFDELAIRCVRESWLNWEVGPDVLDRFKDACMRATRNKSRRHRLPKPHHGLTDIMLPHRYTGGGIEVAKLYSARARRCTLTRVPEDAYTANTAGCKVRRVSLCNFDIYGLATMRLRVIVHRAIPAAAIVKRVQLVGRKPHGRMRDWTWTLNVTVETPPVPVRPRMLPAIGVDIGWRKMDGYTRVAVLQDSDGRQFEVRLGDESPNYRSRRHDLPCGWEDLEVYQQRMDRMVDQTKERIAGYLFNNVTSEEFERATMHLDRMRIGGLVRLKQQESCPKWIAGMIEGLLAAFDHVLKNQRELRERLIARRRYVYRSIARWLVESYDVIAVEDMDISDMAEDFPDRDPALRAAQRQRHYASVSELRRYIREACGSSGATVVNVPAAKTTVTCRHCGQEARPGKQLVLECPCGRQWDQDLNAAGNLLAAAIEVTGTPPVVRKVLVPGQGRQLDGVVVPVDLIDKERASA